jgi:hypothetical protein
MPMEANMMAIRNPGAEAAALTVKSPLDSHERRPHQFDAKRVKAAYYFTLDALQRTGGSLAHGDERRTGKTAKLINLYTRLNFGAL